MNSRIEELKKITGIEKANCESCLCGFPDYSGALADIFCGTECTKRQEPGMSKYVEDDGVDPAEERDCWEPNFWCSSFIDLVDETDESLVNALVSFAEAIRE